MHHVSNRVKFVKEGSLDTLNEPGQTSRVNWERCRRFFPSAEGELGMLP